jgi:SAM-dependent methyltransferase
VCHESADEEHQFCAIAGTDAAGGQLEGTMRFQKCTACYRFALLILSISLAGAQTNQPEVPYVPTTEEAVHAMLKLGDVKKTDVVYDLGCGDGRIVIAAAQTYGARGVGIDINPERIQEAKENAKKAGIENLVRFEENDLFKADIHEATVVTLFLLPKVNLRLRPKLLRELKPGTRIVSNTFDMGDWKPDKEQTLRGEDPSFGDHPLSRKFFLWIVPQRDAK